MASLQILGPLTSCYHTFNTNDPSFVIGSCQVIFLVLTFDHSVTTYSALDETHEAEELDARFQFLTLFDRCGMGAFNLLTKVYV